MDGPNASYITPTALDRWEKRLEDLFEGRPYDMYDAALSDTVSKFPVDIQVNRPTESTTTCLGNCQKFLLTSQISNLLMFPPTLLGLCFVSSRSKI